MLPMLPMLAPACNEAPRSSTPPAAAESGDAAHDMARIDADVPLDVALKRIAILEREVAELKAGPATVEADMLRQQLSATRNALADASRDSVPDDATPVQGPASAGSRAAPKAQPNRPAEQATTAPRAGKTPAARPNLDLDLR